MSRLIGIAAVVGVLLCLLWLRSAYLERRAEDPYSTGYQEASEGAEPEINPRLLSGLDPRYEQSLQQARRGGADGLKQWLQTYGHLVKDPRRAWIELDYAVLVATKDPAEARTVFAEVKKRTSKGSPIWPRIEKLSKTFD